MKQDIPQPIIDAINAMLTPYGRTWADTSPVAVKEIEEPRFLSLRDAMIYSGLKRWNLYNHARQGHFTWKKIGQARRSPVLIEKKSFDQWLDAYSGKVRKSS